MKEVFFQKIQGFIKWNKVKRYGESIKGKIESFKNIRLKLLNYYVWDYYYVVQILKDMWKFKEKLLEIIFIK